MNRVSAGLLVLFIVCCSGICLAAEKQNGERESQNSQDQAGKTKRVKKKIGPFEIDKKQISVILDITEYEGQTHLYHSFEIKDETGVSFYKKELGSTPESNTAIEGIYKLEGKSGEGLIFYFFTAPNAPPAGDSFQVFGMEKGKIKPLSPEINIYGRLQPLPKGKSPSSIRLFDGDLIKVEVWKDFFVVVPLVIDLQKLTIAPLRTTGLFDINVNATLNAPGTENQSNIEFYQDHNVESKVTLIRYEEVKKVEFMNAFANVQLKTKPRSPYLNIDVADLWVKVKINGQQGWVHDFDSLVTLGLAYGG